MSTAALFLVISAMLQNLSFGSLLSALAIAASSAEYGFCSSLLPKVTEKDYVSLLCMLIAPPIATTPFRAELLTAMRTAQFASRLCAAFSTTICTLFSHSASTPRRIVSICSISISLSTSATWNSGERYCLLNFRIRDVFLRSRFVSSSAWISVHSLTACFQNYSCALGICASASATHVATVLNVPTIARAPILCTLLMGLINLSLEACIHTFDV